MYEKDELVRITGARTNDKEARDDRMGRLNRTLTYITCFFYIFFAAFISIKKYLKFSKIRFIMLSICV